MPDAYYLPHIKANVVKHSKVNDLSCLALGVAAGILTLELLRGFAFYLIGLVLINALFFIVCCEGNPTRFFKLPLSSAGSAVLSNIPGFVMMWCLVYALVKLS